MSTLTKKLQEITERANKANQSYESEDSNGTLLIRGLTTDFAYEMLKWDRDFIAHSRQDIPRLVKALEACMEQRRRMVYNELTEAERKMFFANKVLDSMDEELEAILEGGE